MMILHKHQSLLLLSAQSLSDTSCMAPFVSLWDGHCVYVGTSSVLWATAQSTCETMGGQLITLDDECKHDIVADYFYSLYPTESKSYAGVNAHDEHPTKFATSIISHKPCICMSFIMLVSEKVRPFTKWK